MYKGDNYDDKFKWFIGVVQDETTESRVRVRVFGVHPFDEQGNEGGPSTMAVSNGDLPWANLIYPIDSTIPNHDLSPEDWVFGFFADGDSAQQPVIVGKLTRGDGSIGSQFLGTGNSSNGFGSPGGNTSDPGGGGLSGDNQSPSKINSLKYYDYIPGDSNQQKAFNLYATFYEEKGASEEQAKSLAAGTVASLIAESGTNLKTTAVGDTNTSDYAWGVAQWRLNRKQGLYQMCGHKSGNLGCQLNFSIAELENRGHGVKSENSHSSVLRHMLNSSTPYEAAYNWTVYYEIPANRQSKGNSRGATAQAVYNRLAPNYQRAVITGGRTPQEETTGAQ